MQARISITHEAKLTKEKDIRQAAAKGNLDVIIKLHSEGTDISSAGPDSGKTPLHWASQYGHTKTVEFLLSTGDVKIDDKDHDGNTALNNVIQSDKAKLIDRIRIIDYLINSGASPLISNNAGRTPFMNFSKIRDDKELASKPHLLREVTTIIRTIKKYIAEMALRKQVSVKIRPNGEVIFGAIEQLITSLNSTDIPSSGLLTLTPMSLESSQPIKIARRS